MSKTKQRCRVATIFFTCLCPSLHFLSLLATAGCVCHCCSRWVSFSRLLAPCSIIDRFRIGTVCEFVSYRAIRFPWISSPSTLTFSVCPPACFAFFISRNRKPFISKLGDPVVVAFSMVRYHFVLAKSRRRKKRNDTNFKTNSLCRRLWSISFCFRRNFSLHLSFLEIRTHTLDDTSKTRSTCITCCIRTEIRLYI